MTTFQTKLENAQSKTEKVKEIVFELGWDYDRMSSSGREYYDELCAILNLEPVSPLNQD